MLLPLPRAREVGEGAWAVRLGKAVKCGESAGPSLALPRKRERGRAVRTEAQCE
jgi:hypothetical protein